MSAKLRRDISHVLPFRPSKISRFSQRKRFVGKSLAFLLLHTFPTQTESPPLIGFTIIADFSTMVVIGMSTCK
jgi:hypothetical protein